MRKLILAGVVLTLAACGGSGDTETNQANGMMVDNMMIDQNMMMDQNGSMNALPPMDGNGAMDANTQNMMQQDATTNDPDTNLANGL